MSDGSATPRNPYTRPGFIVAAVVVAAVLAAAVVVLTSGLLKGPAPKPTVSDTPSADAEAPIASDLSVCGLEGFEHSSSLVAAPENEWELVGTVAAPTAPTAGPGVVDADGFRSCFAHTASGALFAAVNYVALSSDPRLQPHVWRLMEPGEVRDQAEAAAANGAEPSSSRLQVAGFRVLKYDGATAVVDVAWQVTAPNDGLMSLPVELTWMDGDWYLATTSTGLPYAPASIQNLGGYIPWSGA